MDILKISRILNEKLEFIEEIINSYLEQSFGNLEFTKLLYFIAMMPNIDIKLKRSSIF